MLIMPEFSRRPELVRRRLEVRPVVDAWFDGSAVVLAFEEVWKPGVPSPALQLVARLEKVEVAQLRDRLGEALNLAYKRAERESRFAARESGGEAGGVPLAVAAVSDVNPFRWRVG